MTLHITRTAEPETPTAQGLPSRVHPEVVMKSDLVGLSPAEAEKRLGYPDRDPFGSAPTIIGQDAFVDLTAPTVVTDACMITRDEAEFRGLETSTGTLVLEVVNPEQIDPRELVNLTRVTYQSRQRHIEDETGCSSDTIGVPVRPRG